MNIIERNSQDLAGILVESQSGFVPAIEIVVKGRF